MKKNKLSLDQLKVKSFTTSDTNSLKGGTDGHQFTYDCHSWHNGRPVLCRPPHHTEDCGGN
ncbi:MAG: pinensin family lanthipeptide [Bacteroidota bacterium]